MTPLRNPRSNSAPRLDRRLLPRPLPAHLASAMLLWQSSRAALPSLPNGWPSWSAPAPRLDARLAALAEEIAQRGAEPVAAALDRELARRAALFAAGLDAYRRHPYRRAKGSVPVRWQQGNARLLDYGGARAGPAVLVVPSLINRFTILDLLRERSFVRHLAQAGLRSLVLDWGEPGETERGFALADYLAGPLPAALDAAAALAGGRVGLLGYCMGGLLTLTLALRRPKTVGSLALLATPWDFHAERPGQAQLLAALIEVLLPALLGFSEPVPVAVIQGLFMMLDPFLAERKFVRFAALDMAGEEARLFVALEDWLNDGVPLAARVARDCARQWYRDNAPGRGLWQIAGEPIRPQDLGVPALIVLPSRDKIVPPRSAAPLADLIPGAGVLRPPFGHIGMMASAQAPDPVWRPIAEWLRARTITG